MAEYSRAGCIAATSSWPVAQQKRKTHAEESTIVDKTFAICNSMRNPMSIEAPSLYIQDISGANYSVTHQENG